MTIFLIIILILLSPGTVIAASAESPAVIPGIEAPLTLKEIIDYALVNNPSIRNSLKDIEIGETGIRKAKSDRLPKFDLFGNRTKYRYPSPIWPISGSPLEGAAFPDFDDTIYNVGVLGTLPIYKGGRVERGITIASLSKSVAEDISRMNKTDLVCNIKSVFYKILQIERLIEAQQAAVVQFEDHKRIVKQLLEQGTVAKIDMLKVEVELAHSQQRLIVLNNNRDNSYEALKTLMGFDDTEKTIHIKEGPADNIFRCTQQECIQTALSQRPDYMALIKQQKISEEKVKYIEGKQYPHFFVSGNYLKQSGKDFSFKENWNVGVGLTMPIFDGGLIKAEADSERISAEKAREQERSLRLSINREIKEALSGLENADSRIRVTLAAINEARENLRIERLKYQNGEGTSTDVIDAQTAFLRAQSDYYQAIYDRETAMAQLVRATGETPEIKAADGKKTSKD